jgi:hypothetical protein
VYMFLFLFLVSKNSYIYDNSMNPPYDSIDTRLELFLVWCKVLSLLDIYHVPHHHA